MIAVAGLIIELTILALFNLLQGGFADIGNMGATAAIFIYSTILLVYVSNNRRLQSLKDSFLLGYFFRIFLLYFDIFARGIFILPQSGGDADMFYWGAVRYAQYGGFTRGLFPKIMGTLFRLIGTNHLFGQYLNVLCSMVTLTYLAYSMNELEISLTVKKRIYRIVCLLPMFAILSSIFLREAPIAMFLSISFYYFTRWVRRKSIIHLAIAMLLVLPASALHSGTIAILGGYVAILMVYDNRRERVHIKPQNILLALLVLFAAAYFLSRNEETYLGKFESVESIEDIANTNTEGDASYAQYVGNSSDPVSLVIFTPLRMIFFLFSPFPWQWRGVKDIIAVLFSSLYYFAAFWQSLRLLRRRHAPNRGIVFALFVLALAAVFVFGWGVSNTGTATRHRDKLVTLFALLWATSLDGLRPPMLPNEENISFEVRQP